MAITGTGVATNRSNIQLPNEVSSEIIQKTLESSRVMALARRISLPGNGLQIPIIAGDPEAEWVTETGVKPVSNPTLDKRVMQGHKLAVIVPFSDEFRRDSRALYDALVSRLPNVLAGKFDATVFFGPSAGTTLANFDSFVGITAQSLSTNVYDGLVAADTDISEQGGSITGYIFSPQGRGMLLSAKDGDQRPLFINSVAEGSVPRILGAPTYFSKAVYKAGDNTNPDIVGFAGDWAHAMYGVVEGVNITVSDQATLTTTGGTINLFQQNMFAVRAEIEVGFIAEKEYFNALTRTHQ